MRLRRCAMLVLAAGVVTGGTRPTSLERCRGDDNVDVSPQPFGGKIVRVEKTDAQWKRQLTRRQFEVTRRKNTEAPYTGKLLHNKRSGTYRCVCCRLELFASDAKFESDTGWPSFWAPIDQEHVALAVDRSDPDDVRTEVTCARCDAHLGHVFADGPPPTGLRFCMNSIALSFEESHAAGSSRNGSKSPPARAPRRAKAD